MSTTTTTNNVKEDCSLINQENGHKVNLDELKSKFVKYSGGSIVLEKDDVTGIATIKLDNPSRKNALSGSMMIDLSNIVDELEKWEKGKGLILYGSGCFFSSGGDMNTVKAIDNSDDGRDMGILMYDTLQRLQGLPLISVALIEGQAIGGGAEVTTACDFRLMTRKAKIGFVHIKLGITVSWGGGTRLVQIIGSHKALELISSGRQLTAQEAFDIGLVTHIIEDDKEENEANGDNQANAATTRNLEYAKDWLSKHIAGPRQTINAIKSIVHGARTLPFRESLKRELQVFPQLWGSPPHKKALSMNIKLR